MQIHYLSIDALHSQLSTVYHKLQKLHWRGLSAKDQRGYNIRIQTNRSSDAPPLEPPHNFGIDIDWYNKMKKNAELKEYFTLKRWMKYKDPDGFGKKAPAEKPYVSSESESSDDDGDRRNEAGEVPELLAVEYPRGNPSTRSDGVALLPFGGVLGLSGVGVPASGFFPGPEGGLLGAG